MPINSREKGKSFELKVSRILSEWWGMDFRRTPNSGGFHWRNDHRVAGDIIPPPGAKFPFTVECKKHESWDFEQIVKNTGDVEKFWQQACSDAERVQLKPMLIFSKNRSPDYVMMFYIDFIMIVGDNSNALTYFILNRPEKEQRVIFVLQDFIKAFSKNTVLKAFLTKRTPVISS